MKPEMRPTARTVDLLFTMDKTDQFVLTDVNPEARTIRVLSCKSQPCAAIVISRSSLPMIRHAVEQMERWIKEWERTERNRT